MSLQPSPVPPVPAETARVARAAFRRGHPYLKLRDQFGAFFQDEQFASLFSPCGQPAVAPWRLALICVLQFAENLTDVQAADAVRGRIEWKYLLSLPLEDEGFDASVLCEFRDRLIAGGAEGVLFETLLSAFREQKLVKARGTQRTDSTHVLAAIRRLNRLELVGETMRHTLDVLAVAAPEWLMAHQGEGWLQRYGRRFGGLRQPTGEKEREALAQQIGADGVHLLAALQAQDTPSELRELPEAVLLHQVWEQQYEREGDTVRLRREEALPPAPERIISPHDTEARCALKQSTSWVGYKMHITETCDEGAPRVITDVQTTPAPQEDATVLPTIQACLAARDLLPSQHLTDAGYTEGGAMVDSQQRHQVDLIGPLQEDTSWQARAGRGFAAHDFTVNWQERVVTCPHGRRSIGWKERDEDGRPVIKARFGKRECQACPLREQCTRSQTAGRGLTLPTQAVYEALAAGRARQRTAEFATKYAARAGVEGTHAQGVRRCGVRQCRYVGEKKTHLQHLLTAAAINLIRVGEWLMGREPARTRVTRFSQLATVPS